MHKKSLLGVAACTLALAGLGTAPAYAAGQTERGPEHANSMCSFSGLNDDPLDPYDPGRVQNYGKIVKSGGKQFAPGPGLLCNGHLFPAPWPTEEPPA